MYLVVLAVFVVLFSPRVAFAASHTSRLQIPLHKSTVIVEKKDEATTKKILVSDYLSSTKVVISEKGTVSNAPSYYPYGSSITQVPLRETNKQYTGQQKVTDESSVYNYNARYYNPTSALFIQPDSVKGPVRYGYVSNNPVMAADPTGHDLCQQDPSMKYFWKAIGQCGGDEKGEKFMGEEGLNSVGTLMASTEAVSGIGGIATWIGDKINGTSAGSESIDSAYKSLGRGAAAGILALGMLSPGPGDVERGVARVSEGSVERLIKHRISDGDAAYALQERLSMHGINTRVLSDSWSGSYGIVNTDKKVLTQLNIDLTEGIRNLPPLITHLYVREDLRVTGVGRKVVQEFEQYIADTGRAIWGVNRPKDSAKPFWSKMGFRPPEDLSATEVAASRNARRIVEHLTTLVSSPGHNWYNYKP